MVATLASTGLIAAFMQTLVTPIIPHLPQYLDTSLADSSWVLTSTLLAAAISTPIAGRLGDMYGKRRIMLTLLLIMSAGSIICALSNTLAPMVVGRTLQGVGLGVIALGISILRDILHRKNLGAAIALVSATLGIGGAIGLPISALVAENADYHYLFWMATVLSLAAFVAVLSVIPVSTLRTGGRFDYLGALGFALGLVLFLLAVSKGTAWGWSSPLTLGMLGAAVVIFAAWGFYELRVHSPLVDLRVAARRPVLLTNIASISVGFAFFTTAAALPVLLEAPTATGVGLGQSLLVASLCLMPSGLVMFFVSSTAAKLSAARGPKTSLILGGSIITLTFAIGAFALTEVWHIVLVSSFAGLGTGFAYAAMPTLIMHSVPASETAAANGLNSVMRTLGSTAAATVVGIILSSWFVVHEGVSVPTHGAFQATFLVGAGVALAGVIVAAFIPRSEPRYDDTASIPVQRISPSA